ncbi:hypothetical protein D3C87_1704820 [compost metagenome]
MPKLCGGVRPDFRAIRPMKWPHQGVRAGLMPSAVRSRLLFLTSCRPLYCWAWANMPGVATSGVKSAT